LSHYFDSPCPAFSRRNQTFNFFRLDGAKEIYRVGKIPFAAEEPIFNCGVFVKLKMFAQSDVKAFIRHPQFIQRSNHLGRVIKPIKVELGFI
jgi:hypothetical protein